MNSRTREDILAILEEEGPLMKVIELALAFWVRRNPNEPVPEGLIPPEQLEELHKVERLLLLFLPEMAEEGILEFDAKYVRLKETANGYCNYVAG